jgi:glutamine synthetase
VLKLIKEKEVKFVDCASPIPAARSSTFRCRARCSHDKFESGHAFDGSSIAGWKGIQSSDMLLMPDANAAYIDPFMDETTLNITCDVVEPSDGKGYERDPRSLAKRADAYLKSTGLGDVAYFGPEPSSSSSTRSSGRSTCREAIARSSRAKHRGRRPRSSRRQHGSPSAGEGGYFPVPPVDSLQDLRSAICLALEQMGVEVEVTTSRGCRRRAERDRHEVRAARAARATGCRY